MIDGSSNKVGAQAPLPRKQLAASGRQEEVHPGPAETVSINRDNYPMGIYGDDGTARSAPAPTRELNAQNYPGGIYGEGELDLASRPFPSTIDNAVAFHEEGHRLAMDPPSTCLCDQEPFLADSLARGLKTGDAEVVRTSLLWMQQHYPMGIYGDDGSAPPAQAWNLADAKKSNPDGIYS